MDGKLTKAALGIVALIGTGVTAASAAPAAAPRPSANVGSTGAAQASTTASNSGLGLPVLVENRAGQEVPVTGAVNVGNLPAVQNVNGTVNVGNLPAVQDVQVVAPAETQVVLQATADLTETNPPPVGLTYVKVLRADTGTGQLSGRYGVTSITLGQFGGSQELPVILRAASCDNQNGYGELEDVIVPQGQTVQLTYPSPMQLPFVQSAPAAWCLFAATVQDDGQLHVSVVGRPRSRYCCCGGGGWYGGFCGYW
jgi:hypothetical protein